MGTLVPTTIPTIRELPLIEEIATTDLDPWEVCRRLASLPHVIFLDSAQTGSRLGRYSFITADPFTWFWSRGNSIWQEGQGLLSASDPFQVLARRLAESPLPAVSGLPPFQGGAAGLFGYDLCHHLERLPRPTFDDFQAPDLAVGIYDWVIAFDHAADRAWLMSTGVPERENRRRGQRALQRRDQVLRLLEQPPASLAWHAPTRLKIAAPHHAVPGVPGLASNFSRESYLAAARRAIDYVHAGDCFQVNIAQRLLMPATLPPLEFYGQLRQRNPAPFAGYFDLGDFVIASASPERFLHVLQGDVETRPIKGTRPRSDDPVVDRARAAELLASAKDHAENVMIVDLLRNDLGRVCRYGSVRVASVCRLESFRHVHHLVSEVRGRLREGLGPLDLLRAAFPGGSVTGAPKIRAMEIIAELEPTARGPYCGSLGYLGFDGAMDTNLLIRTITMGKGWLQFPVGGGIVADSNPQREYEETWHKARGLVSCP